MAHTTRPLTRWQRLTAAGVEGLFLLLVLIGRLADSACLLAAFVAGAPAAYALAVGVSLLQTGLLAPLRLGRWLWYRELLQRPGSLPPIRRLFRGYRCPLAALGWQWGVWWRQTVLLGVTTLPATLLFGYGEYLSRLNEPAALVWGILGGLALVAAGITVLLYRCRYALVPLLLAEGQPVSLALPLSRRLSRRRTGEWVNFWGEHSGRLLAGLAPGVGLWIWPAVMHAYTARLNSWLCAPVPPDDGRTKIRRASV